MPRELVHPLIQFFVDLCLLRRAPQDLPASRVLFGLVLAVDLSIALLLGAVVGLTPLVAFAEGSLDAGGSLGLLYLALRLFDRRHRFFQTATALLGAGATLGFLALFPLTLLAGDSQADSRDLAALLLLLLIAWSVLVTAHILRHGFDLRLTQGAMIAVAYQWFSYLLIDLLFSGS